MTASILNVWMVCWTFLPFHSPSPKILWKGQLCRMGLLIFFNTPLKTRVALVPAVLIPSMIPAYSFPDLAVNQMPHA